MNKWNKLKQIIEKRLYPKSLYIGYTINRNEQQDGNIAGTQVYGANVSRISLDEVDEKIFENFKYKHKIVKFHDTKHPMMLIRSNTDYFINQQECIALYRLCSVYGKWNDEKSFIFDKEEVDKTIASMNGFISDFVELIMGEKIGSKVRITTITPK